MSEEEMDALDAKLLPCPFCGAPSDACRNEEGEGYIGCSDSKCPAHKLAMTDEQWNRRAAQPCRHDMDVESRCTKCGKTMQQIICSI